MPSLGHLALVVTLSLGASCRRAPAPAIVEHLPDPDPLIYFTGIESGEQKLFFYSTSEGPQRFRVETKDRVVLADWIDETELAWKYPELSKHYESKTDWLFY